MDPRKYSNEVEMLCASYVWRRHGNGAFGIGKSSMELVGEGKHNEICLLIAYLAARRSRS
jgi:hypothetical protein